MRSKFIMFCWLATSIPLSTTKAMNGMGLIVTTNSPRESILRSQCETISRSEWHIARETAQKLLETREKIGGGAGLAAPQIGIQRAVFIYSPNRSKEKLRVVINPSYQPMGSLVAKEEACFSVPLHITTLERWSTIHVHYQDLNGNEVEETLEGFPAQVFQHEMDHLRGVLTIDHEGAQLQKFSTVEDFEEHMSRVRNADAKQYK